MYQTSILDDDFQKVVLEVRKMNLEVPTHEHILKNNRLSEAEIHRVARNLVGAPTSCHLIEAREKSMDPERERRIAEYVRKIHEDYDGKVLVHEVPLIPWFVVSMARLSSNSRKRQPPNVKSLSFCTESEKRP